MTDSAFSNYNIALRKYEQYLFWESENAIIRITY